MDIRKIPLSMVSAAEYNPRIDLKPGDPEYEKLKRSIEEFGYVEPLVWNERTGNLVGGHQRFKILINEQQATEVEVSVVDLDDTREKALNLALNKISGDWDEEKLAYVLGELQESDLDISLSGFENEEVIELLSEYLGIDVEEPVVDDDFDVQQALGEIQEPETKLGDIWRLGRHLLMCGDSTHRHDVQDLMDGVKAALVVTDPPYNVAFKSDSSELAADGRASIMNDDMPMEKFEEFLGYIFQNYSDLMDDKAAIYVFHPSSYQREFETKMNEAGIVVRTQCVWVKNAATFGFAQYKFKHEPVFYGHLKGQAPAWYGDRKQTTVWRSGLLGEQQEPNSVWEVSRGDVSKYVHPTQKPLELLAIPIGNSSQKGDIVVDLFGGSGSTLMTCEQMGRSCRTMELDAKSCDVIKKRFFQATGIEPVLIKRLGEAA
ncbi:site-specific DNA-methyltransferase [Brevibacillus porteri]|uniref:DNA modification methylase n=1 Tax=Brevibacillus porteri TaxID=2126350 RepID=A0ABX5FIX3_9BACL|nr:site-specific DNA-methyltransferase [Brevibacillus porteri]MED1801707.1 site-specific DNA-methyltransferase [Brevibacillus porteri]MED2135273.1 site-specific DNA-methyltransferase [Brevibacillus porteri]MED2748013.1 site-specific DNA-methyltransferase [Brevibacillus porteri]MED2813755.1 site-specific DNA-methyltransferase [Brevibacillus porteri]MED2894751.1 site-specific DNA-methyltransferase [Brevibacillus porteri]